MNSSIDLSTKRNFAQKPLAVTPGMIVLLYAVSGCLWILFSSYVLKLVVIDPVAVFYLETLKGWIYVGFTACVLLLLIKKSIATIRESESALAESRDTYKTLIEQASDGIVIVDEHGWLIDGNPAILEMSNYTAEEFKSLTVHDLFPGNRDEKTPLGINDLREGNTAVFQLQMKRKNGSLLNVESSAKVLPNGRVQAIVRDITERVLFENALREGEAKYRELFENANDLIYTRDLDGRLTSVNKACEQAFGYSREELIGKHISELGSPEDVDQFWSSDDGTAPPNGLRSFEFTRKSGERIDLEVNERPVYRKGCLAAIQGIARDITERIRTQNDLKQTKQWLAAIFEASQDAIVVECDERIVFINDRYLATYGYSNAAEVIGKPMDEFETEAENVRLRAYGHMRLRGEEAPMVYEFRGRRKDGSEIDMEATISTFTSDGRFYIVTAEKDITARKAAEGALRNREEELLQAQKMEAVGRLAGGIAHDFNNILTAITGGADMLKRQIENPAHRVKLEQISKAANRAALLTKQLLAFSRKQILQPKLLNLNTVVSDVCSMLRPVIGEDIELVMSLGTSLGSVKVDPGQISQVILNLAVNARDAMPRGGRLTVETMNVELDEAASAEHSLLPATYTMLAISDTGVGMDHDLQKHIFEPFFTTKEVGKGTGLGLSMAYGIVTQSGGSITVESKPGAGSSFKIYLPRQTQTGPEGEREIDIMNPLLNGKGTILLVEDEELVRSLGRQILELCGYTVLEASNGQDALEICDKLSGEIDLLLTDVVMPGMTGIELGKKLSQLNSRIKILYTSGYAEAEALKGMNWDDHQQFLQKPFTPDMLAKKVSEVLSASST
jgi:two-component system cell cycle sensor histidine kinase/response regulator CckA